MTFCSTFLGGDEITKNFVYLTGFWGCETKVEYYIGIRRNKNGKIFNLNDDELKEGHCYVLFNYANEVVKRLSK